jgi:hypothetical protein
MEYTEELKKGLRHNRAEPEDYVWLSNGDEMYKAPTAEINMSLSIEQKFSAAKSLFDSNNKDVYKVEISQ